MALFTRFCVNMFGAAVLMGAIAESIKAHILPGPAGGKESFVCI